MVLRAFLFPCAWGQVTYEQINQLKYIHATATEVLRLYPSVPKEGKWAFRDNVLPDGTRYYAFPLLPLKATRTDRINYPPIRLLRNTPTRG